MELLLDWGILIMMIQLQKFVRFGEGNSEEGIGKEIKSGGKKGNFQLGTEKFFEKKREKWRED